MAERRCIHCGSSERELRPYGPNGADVCFPCVMGDDAPVERKRTAEGVFASRLLHPSNLLLDSREEAGPRPLKGVPR